jgi:hypothetical protein
VAKSTRKKAKTTAARAGGTRKTAGRGRAAKRERLAPKGDTRYVRRAASGRFKESDDAGRAQTRDRATRAKRATSAGQGDRGDRKRSSTSTSRGRS